ncbi:hypothetical protein A3715_18305 [Oleiphilus sp. HI0009]|nr:hypothetical protein A3715_18305 [Oleiphilus sp. HI0009]
MKTYPKGTKAYGPLGGYWIKGTMFWWWNNKRLVIGGPVIATRFVLPEPNKDKIPKQIAVQKS